MSNRNDAQRFVLPDNLTQDWLIPYAYNSTQIAVAVGDLCYYKGNGVIYPADQLTSAGTEAADQAAFALLFAGISTQQVLLAEVNPNKRITLRTYAVCEFDCPSQTFNPGDGLAIFSDGTTINPQKVDAVKSGGTAIGKVIKYYGSVTTRVRGIFKALYTL